MRSKIFKSFQKAAQKMRTKQEVDADYTHQAVQLGHKARIVSQLQEEMDEHIRRLGEINQEAMALPQDATPTAPVATAPEAKPETEPQPEAANAG